MYIKHEKTCRSCKELLLEFENEIQVNTSSKLLFDFGEQNPGVDVYNITAPFESDGKTWIAGRVEKRDSEYSNIIFFRKDGDVWRAEKAIDPIPLQDPFVSKIEDEIVLGGVEVYDNPLELGSLLYRTVFLRGTSIYKLERFAKGPERMKDIRLCRIGENRILVFTRPQGTIGGRGTIGYMQISRLEELSEESITDSRLLRHQFIEEEWGGANELHILKNGKIGILSHIASFDEKGNRHYYSTAFSFDSETGEYSPMKLIAIRKNFAEGETKREDLMDVIFSGGLIRQENGMAELYCGVSDAEGHKITISDPFLDYEVENKQL